MHIDDEAAGVAGANRAVGQTQDLLKSIVWGTAVTVLLVLLYVAWLESQTLVLGAKLVFHQKRFLLYAFAGAVMPMISCALVVLGGLRTTRAGRSAAVRAISRRFVAALAIACCLSTAVTLWFYRQKGAEDTLDTLQAGMRLETIDPQYRYAVSDNRLTLSGAAAGTSGFSSTISAATVRLEQAFDYPLNAVVHLNKESILGLSELLGGKYGIAVGWVPEGWRRVEEKTLLLAERNLRCSSAMLAPWQRCAIVITPRRAA